MRLDFKRVLNSVVIIRAKKKHSFPQNLNARTDSISYDYNRFIQRIFINKISSASLISNKVSSASMFQ